MNIFEKIVKGFITKNLTISKGNSQNFETREVSTMANREIIGKN